jgi:hypothetical protein
MRLRPQEKGLAHQLSAEDLDDQVRSRAYVDDLIPREEAVELDGATCLLASTPR